MPSDEPQSRPNLDAYRSNNSHRSQRHANETSSDSPSNTPPSTLHKGKGSKTHVVSSRAHTRVPSYGKGLQKLTKVQESYVPKAQRRTASPARSPEPLSMKPAGPNGKISRNGSTTSLRNSSHGSLKRNRSHGEVKRPRSAGQLKRSSSQPGAGNSKSLHKTSVHFDLGNDGQDDGWTEASGSASPNLSRTDSIGGASSGRSSAKPGASTNNSQPHSPTTIHSEARDWASTRQGSVAPDAHQITSRLLQRTPSQNAPPQMSSISVTATPGNHSLGSFIKVTATSNGMFQTNQDELVSRFVGTNSGTSNSTSPSHHSQQMSEPKMSSLSRQPSTSSDEDKRVLAPRSRSRKPSADSHAYNPPQHSRTQQKLWLERASSNIEPQMVPGAALNGIGIPGLRPLLGASPLVGAGDDGRDPRIRLQLERTGLEYLVVRRYQDPVGRALKRLDSLPGAEKHRRIPTHRARKGPDGLGSGQGRYGLSQSLRETRMRNGNGVTVTSSGARSSYEPPSEGGSTDSGKSVPDDNEISTILRSLWERNLDLGGGEE